MVIAGLLIVLVLVLVLPFAIHMVEENLEVFLFIMGVSAAFISGIMSMELAIKAMEEPIKIASAVLIAGALFFLFRNKFEQGMTAILARIPLAIVVFFVIVILGLLSSVITAIIAAIILVEIIILLPIDRPRKIVICVIACFAIGLGAALTPIGEPLATIAISKLNQDFFYLLKLLGKYIIPAVIAMGLFGAIYTHNILKKSQYNAESELALTSEDITLPEEEITRDSWRGIIVRALKVYLFVMALVFLGEGFHPLIDKYILVLDYRVLYWVNTISAVLDNATLTAAEISIQMTTLQIEAILMGLIISGGMLIPGNIPNIISASKLKITSTEWARIGLPLGFIVMIIFYFVLF